MIVYILMSDEEVELTEEEKKERDELFVKTTLEKIKQKGVVEALNRSFRPVLRELLDLKGITLSEHKDYIALCEEASKANVKKLETVQSKITMDFEKDKKDSICKDCGEALNAGTYAIIYQSLTNPNRVIKGNISKNTDEGCKGEFQKEYAMYTKIKQAKPEFNLISFIKITKNWIEDGRCYLEMDKIEPVILSPKEKESCIVMAKCNKLNAFLLKKFMLEDSIYALLPGEAYATFGTGGNKSSKWIETGDYAISLFFKILGLNKKKYYTELRYALRYFKRKNIALIDVEFILGSVNGKNGIFMIDFDKVQTDVLLSKDEYKNLIDNQTMFPVRPSEKPEGYDADLERYLFEPEPSHVYNTKYQTRKRANSIRRMDALIAKSASKPRMTRRRSKKVRTI